MNVWFWLALAAFVIGFLAALLAALRGEFPGRALLDLRIGHKERHPVHAEPISFMLTWPPYVSFSFLIPFTNPRKQFWFYVGWEPEFDHWDFTWWALKITKGHTDTGRDENNVPQKKY